MVQCDTLVFHGKLINVAIIYTGNIEEITEQNRTEKYLVILGAIRLKIHSICHTVFHLQQFYETFVRKSLSSNTEPGL